VGFTPRLDEGREPIVTAVEQWRGCAAGQHESGTAGHELDTGDDQSGDAVCGRRQQWGAGDVLPGEVKGEKNWGLPNIDFGLRAVDYQSMKASALKMLVEQWPYGLEVRPSENGLLLALRRKPRAGWPKAFRRPRQKTDELSPLRQASNKFDLKEWEW
jgi:hypothetical protein